MPDRLRLILGVKLRTLRQERGLGLKDVARKAGLSVSYLSEIEQGKKYPKPDKLVDLSVALGVAYDDLVSLRVDKGLDAIKDVIESPLLRSFPFALFGVDAESLVRLLAGVPDRTGALVQAVGDVTRSYDAHVEDFLLAALRAYQQMHANRFPELETVAEAMRADLGLAPEAVPDADRLRAALEGEHGYRVDTERLPASPDLASFRSVLAGPADARVLYVNGALHREQLAFLYARELAFLALGARDRPLTSSWMKVERFDQVLDNFRGSYVAGALLLPAALVDAELQRLAAMETWDEATVLGWLARFRSTPEMLFHRLTQRLPDAIGLDELFFLRFHHDVDTDAYRLTKTFNLSGVAVPHRVSADEHYCRRWPALRALDRLNLQQREAAGTGADDDRPVVVAQREHFVAGIEGDGQADFFSVAVARPLALLGGANSAVELGLRRTRAVGRRVSVWNDPALPEVEVGLTCERCPLTTCRERAAPPKVLRDDADAARRQAALDALGGG